jgi:hypothetical protein
LERVVQRAALHGQELVTGADLPLRLTWRLMASANDELFYWIN